MKLNYKRSKKNIPTSLRTRNRKSFEVLWSDSLSDTQGTKLYGKTEFEPNRIILNKDQSDKDAVLTTWHEYIHAFDHDNEIGLTEGQVLKLEKCYPHIREFVLVLEGKIKK